MNRCLTTICGVLRNAVVARNIEKFSSVIFCSYITRLQRSKYPPISSLQTRSFSHGPPLSKSMIEDRVMLVLQLYDKIDPNKLTLKSDLVKDFGLDSLDMVEVNVAMEEEFTFDIPSADAQRLRTPFDIIQYICDKHDIYE
ncbi:NADH dehydrogenase [Echinococcus multilocularis]|uniref:Acyl carrier protein n=1 Tax=Echinococcus multilocularis TaxID=6211 RepID=A0A068YFI8_ECHMU|nr:NADH dehydrogenase [Echinococcus multilocularis]